MNNPFKKTEKKETKLDPDRLIQNPKHLQPGDHPDDWTFHKTEPIKGAPATEEEAEEEQETAQAERNNTPSPTAVSKPKVSRRWSYAKEEAQVKKGRQWVSDTTKPKKEWDDAGEFVGKWVSEVRDHEKDKSGSVMNIAMRYRMKTREINRYRNQLNKAFKDQGLQVGDELVLKDLPELTERQEAQLREERTSPTQTDLHALLKIAKYRTE